MVAARSILAQGVNSSTLTRVGHLLAGTFLRRTITAPWGVACVLTGSDRYCHYDPPGGVDKPVPQLRFERVLGPGDFVTWLEPPDDIHSQQGIGEAALEIVLFGKNVMAMPRRYYDLVSGRVTTALPQ